jgi:hypothetical protein
LRPLRACRPRDALRPCCSCGSLRSCVALVSLRPLNPLRSSRPCRSGWPCDSLRPLHAGQSLRPLRSLRPCGSGRPWTTLRPRRTVRAVGAVYSRRTSRPCDALRPRTARRPLNVSDVAPLARQPPHPAVTGVEGNVQIAHRITRWRESCRVCHRSFDDNACAVCSSRPWCSWWACRSRIALCSILSVSSSRPVGPRTSCRPRRASRPRWASRPRRAASSSAPNDPKNRAPCEIEVCRRGAGCAWFLDSVRLAVNHHRFVRAVHRRDESEQKQEAFYHVGFKILMPMIMKRISRSTAFA